MFIVGLFNMINFGLVNNVIVKDNWCFMFFENCVIFLFNVCFKFIRMICFLILFFNKFFFSFDKWL